MKAFKEIVLCTTPFMVAAILLYPFVAIVGGGTDPFLWERYDRAFYFLCTTCFGFMLYLRVTHVRRD